jgi:hypothetical protein
MPKYVFQQSFCPNSKRVLMPVFGSLGVRIERPLAQISVGIRVPMGAFFDPSFGVPRGPILCRRGGVGERFGVPSCRPKSRTRSGRRRPVGHRNGALARCRFARNSVSLGALLTSVFGSLEVRTHDRGAGPRGGRTRRLGHRSRTLAAQISVGIRCRSEGVRPSFRIPRDAIIWSTWRRARALRRASRRPKRRARCARRGGPRRPSGH